MFVKEQLHIGTNPKANEEGLSRNEPKDVRGIENATKRPESSSVTSSSKPL